MQSQCDISPSSYYVFKVFDLDRYLIALNNIIINTIIITCTCNFYWLNLIPKLCLFSICTFERDLFPWYASYYIETYEIIELIIEINYKLRLHAPRRNIGSKFKSLASFNHYI